MKRYKIIYQRAKEEDPIDIPILLEDPEGDLGPKEAYEEYWRAYNECQRLINRLIYQLDMIRDSLNRASNQTNSLRW